MGWFWSSSLASKPEGSSSPSATSATSTQNQESPSQQQTQLSADKEVAMFMEMLMNDTKSSTASSPPQTKPSPSPQPQSTTSSSLTSWLPWPFTKSAPTTLSTAPTTTPTTLPIPPKRERSPQSIAMSEHTLPTTMSCRDAFDYAWHCYSPGAQWNAVYRYGSVRPCTELWDDFWFCMRTRTYPPEARAEAIKEHYRAKEARKYGGGKPSSEDIWESREERVPPGTAFREPFEPPVVDDKAYRREDAERRKRLREAAGIKDDGSGN